MLNVTGVPAFADNYIWLVQEKGNPHTIIVDPGESEPVLRHIKHHGLEPIAIFVTHHHGDHTAGIREILQHFDLPVYGPSNEGIATITHPVHEGDKINLAASRLSFSVLEVPGHTRGHIAYVGHGCVFCGDTLFTGGCGLLFEGTPALMFSSLSKIATLPPATQVYCAHEYTQSNLEFARVVEPENADLIKRQTQVRQKRAVNQATVPSTLAEELRTNPFLRCRESSVIQAAEGFAGKPLKTGAEVFAVVRHWKNTLD